MTQQDYLMRFAISYVPPTYKLVIGLLDGKECELADIAHQLKCHVETVRSAITMLRKAKVVRVSGWRRQRSGPPVPAYTLGHEKDHPRPPKKTASEKCKDWRQRKAGTVRLGIWGV